MQLVDNLGVNQENCSEIAMCECESIISSHADCEVPHLSAVVEPVQLLRPIISRNMQLVQILMEIVNSHLTIYRHVKLYGRMWTQCDRVFSPHKIRRDPKCTNERVVQKD